MEEITTPVGQTKNKLWAAYKEVIAELTTLRAGKTDTIANANKKQSVDTAIKVAEGFNYW